MRKEQHQYLKMLQESIANSQICSFNAGRCNYDPATKKVSADPCRGKIQLKKMTEGTVDFEWSERNSRTAAFSRKIVPSFGQWKKCNDCTDGRVYLLEIPGADPIFFWMQEVDEKVDEEMAKKINEAFGVDKEPEVGLNDSQMNVFSQALLGASNNAPAPEAPVAPQAGGLQQAMQEAMRNMLREDPDINDVFPGDRCGDLVEIICSNEEHLDALRSQLPPGENGQPLEPAEIVEHLQSPEFISACRRLSAVFRGGEAQALYSEMGLPTNGMQIGVQAFLNAVNQRYGPQEDEDEEMDN